jgi:hypothetical protein
MQEAAPWLFPGVNQLPLAAYISDAFKRRLSRQPNSVGDQPGHLTMPLMPGPPRPTPVTCPSSGPGIPNCDEEVEQRQFSRSAGSADAPLHDAHLRHITPEDPAGSAVLLSPVPSTAPRANGDMHSGDPQHRAAVSFANGAKDMSGSLETPDGPVRGGAARGSPCNDARQGLTELGLAAGLEASPAVTYVTTPERREAVPRKPSPSALASTPRPSPTAQVETEAPRATSGPVWESQLPSGSDDSCRATTRSAAPEPPPSASRGGHQQDLFGQAPGLGTVAAGMMLAGAGSPQSPYLLPYRPVEVDNRLIEKMDAGAAVARDPTLEGQRLLMPPSTAVTSQNNAVSDTQCGACLSCE